MRSWLVSNRSGMNHGWAWMDLISLHTNISSWMPTMGVAFYISISRAGEMFQVKFRPVSYRDDCNYISQDGSILSVNDVR